MTSRKHAKHLWIIAGPNGSGKATVAAHFFEHELPIIDPRECDQGDWCGRSAANKTPIRAARQLIGKQYQYMRQGKSFVTLTTLSGVYSLRMIHVAKSAGFQVHLIYIGLSSARLSYLRVRQRSRQNEQVLDKSTVVRQYTRGLQRLRDASRIVDHLILLDNSHKKTQFLASAQRGLPRRITPPFPTWLSQVDLSVLAIASDLQIAATQARSDIQERVRELIRSTTTATRIDHQVAIQINESMSRMRVRHLNEQTSVKELGREVSPNIPIAEANAIVSALAELPRPRLALENWYFYQQAMARLNAT